MDRILLFLLDRFSFLFRLLSINYQQLRSIVEVKLKMDGRRQASMFGQKQNLGSEGNGYYISLFIYIIFGFLVSLLLYAVPNTIIPLIVIFSYIMVMVVMILITDFSSVLLDSSDNSIILPRPVDSKTLLAARITHIAMYISVLGFALSLGSIIAITIQYGIATLAAFLICLVMAIIFSVTLTNGLYLFVMRFTNEERLKNTINYLQITMTVFFMGSYQLLPRLIGRFDELSIVFNFYWWTYLIPPVWFAAIVDTTVTSNVANHHLVMLILGLTVPIVSLLIVTKYLAPSFAQSIYKLGLEDSNKKEKQNTSQQKQKKSILKTYESLVKSGPEKAGLLLTVKTLARDRKLKLKIYPAIGYLFVFAVLFGSRLISKDENWFESLQNSPAYLILIYSVSLVMITAFTELTYNDNFKASWVFFSSPIENPGSILSGTLKGVFFSLFVPIYIFFSVVAFIVWKEAIIDDLIFGLTNNTLIIVAIAMINKKQLPLSLPDGARNNAGSFARNLLIMIVIGFLGFLHFGATTINGAVWILIPVFGSITYFMLRSYKNLTWDDLMKE